MADTIARLIFEANTAQLKKANDELKKLAKESGKSARSVDDGTKSQKKNATETQNNTNKTKQNTTAKKKLKKETKDVTTATDKMVVQLKKEAAKKNTYLNYILSFKITIFIDKKGKGLQNTNWL